MKKLITAIISIFGAVFILKNLLRPSLEQVNADERFEKALAYIWQAEGGYSNNPNDRGGPTNFGITQGTYNGWLISKGKLTKDVKEITRSEAKQIYYEDYWQAVGADKTKDLQLAIVLFDSAVNHGVWKAQQLAREANYNINQIIELRKNFYERIVANDYSQQGFLAGWYNRLGNLQTYITTV